ncbi:MAG TPA: succinate dehydrogenase cytochrome b subunit [Gemmatimonadaceae bacterium]|jgi:succinate dehydrogenase / fumarate reductase cytochrome b subunit|nr:succinate dehydrogenase cytochrome b subunit [Gemmatimonadaceae bacterium]
MGRLRGFYASMVGKKAVMGVTGLIGIGFVIIHSLGNLLVFRGPEAINSYSRFLKNTGELLWALRAVLVVAVILHVIAAVQLTRQSRAARPVGYVKRESQVATVSSRTMRWGGALLLVFIVVHILHFTTGTIRPAGVFSREDVYANVLAGFRIWWVALFYVVSMMALGLHLGHGAWSSVRSIGASAPSPQPLNRRISIAIAILVWAAFTAIPVAVVAGLVR